MRNDLSFNALLQSHYRAMRRKLDAIAEAEEASEARPPETAPSTSTAPATLNEAVTGHATTIHPDPLIDAQTRTLLQRIGRR